MKSIWVGIKRGTLLATALRAYAADPDLQQEWMMVKKVNKMRFAEYIEAMSGVKRTELALAVAALSSGFGTGKRANQPRRPPSRLAPA
ncbi:unnamed protein product [Prunus brigantina]